MDLEKAKTSFKKYISQYKSKDSKTEIKEKHTYGVVEASEYIAKELGLSDEEIQLAELIGLLHDIGRFEQAVKYDNFEDYNTIDHADFAVELLFKDNFIREFIKEDSYDEIIKKAIKNHNKFQIEEGLSEKELLFAKIIRDADKVDNFEVKQYQDFESLFKSTEEEVQKEKITNDIWNEFLNEKPIISSHRKTNMDKWISYLAWIYDFNFLPGLRYLKINNSIDKVVDRLDYQDSETKERMEYARKKVKVYIDEKLA